MCGEKFYKNAEFVATTLVPFYLKDMVLFWVSVACIVLELTTIPSTE